MMRRLATFLVVLLITAFAVAWPLSGELGAQDEETPEATEIPPTIVPTATPSAYPFRSLAFTLLAQADLSLEAAGPFVVSAATISVPAQASTVTFVTEGETVISASVGTVSVSSDQAIFDVPDISSSVGLDPVPATPVADEAVTISVGQQVYLGPGATVTLRNDTDKPATLLILTVVAEAPLP